MSEIHSEIYTDSDGSKLRVEQDSRGNKWHSKHGALHRLDGPAVECANGTKHWYKDGKYHRLDGPALEWKGGVKEWYVDDKEVEPSFLVAYWLERGRCCWFNESTQELHFSDLG